VSFCSRLSHTESIVTHSSELTSASKNKAFVLFSAEKQTKANSTQQQQQQQKKKKVH
jgi:hypothetical protein